MLNVNQRRTFENVKSHLVQQKQHEAGVCNCDHKPLHMFVSGVGVTGKSFLIETIKALVCEEFPCAITAPTGLAAFNVGGVTYPLSMTAKLLAIGHCQSRLRK